MHLIAQSPRARRGYTLVELLISVAILGIVGSVLAQIMMGQQRFYQRTVEQMGVRRELRTAINLLPAEWRGLSSACGDLVDFTSTSLTFRSTTGVSLVCARSSATSIDIPPINSAHTITTAWYDRPDPGDTLYALRNDSAGVKGDYWTAHRITSVTGSPLYCPVSPYIDPVLDAGKARYRLTVTPALPDSVVVSSSLRFTRTSKYSLLAQSSGRYYLTRAEYRNGSWASVVPVAGPFRAPGAQGGDGLSLAFYDSAGTEITSTADAAKVARLDVTLRAQGLSGSGAVGGASAAVIDSVALRVALRNRR